MTKGKRQKAQSALIYVNKYEHSDKRQLSRSPYFLDDTLNTPWTQVATKWNASKKVPLYDSSLFHDYFPIIGTLGSRKLLPRFMKAS